MTRARRVNVGSGNEPHAGWINVDIRGVPGVNVVANARALPFADASIDFLRASSVLEHFANPYAVLDEIHRVLRPDGCFEARVPFSWAVWGPLDRTHVFLADLRLWRDVLGGYFNRVTVRSQGARYRDSRVLRALAFGAIAVFRWHELAETWTFASRGRRAHPIRRYIPWWLEEVQR